jgi:hypothetical protein
MEATMRKHKMSFMFVAVFALVALVIGGLTEYKAASTIQSVSAEEAQKYLAATPQNLEYLGLNFTRVEVADIRAQGAITKEQAISLALKEEPNLKVAASISVLLGFLLDANLQQAENQGIQIDPRLANMGLVWLVTFHGIETPSMGPSRSIRSISNEYNVVIDAMTGEYLMAFPLYDVTPSSPKINLANTPEGIEKTTPLPMSNVTPTLPPTFMP